MMMVMTAVVIKEEVEWMLMYVSVFGLNTKDSIVRLPGCCCTLNLLLLLLLLLAVVLQLRLAVVVIFCRRITDSAAAGGISTQSLKTDARMS